jgi:cell wall assembly regulator SMI1
VIDLSNIPLVSVREPSTEAKIKEIESRLGKNFPEKYIQFLKQTDGFDSDEVRLYPIGEIEERNATYEVDKYCPDFINIGDDGGGSAIMVKNASFQDGKVYLVGHGVMTPEFMEVVSAEFEEWLKEGCPLEE